MPRRTLFCRLGLHLDRRVRLDDAWVYRCRRCGRHKGPGPVVTLMGGQGGGI